MKKSRNYFKINNSTHSFEEEFTDNHYQLAKTAWEIDYDYPRIKHQLDSNLTDKRLPSSLKWRLLLPLTANDQLVSLDEGNTPLLPSYRIGKTLNLSHLFFKHEGLNPTGAFKDRGSVVEISLAKSCLARAVVLASTGNMAASVSAYCARARIPCLVFVPDSTPAGKLAQTRIYGGQIIKVAGNYDLAAKLAEQVAKKFNLYLAGDYFFRLEGQKTQAYEIYEQLKSDCPDWVLVPTGTGTNIAAIWRGFLDLRALGFSHKLPKMVAVQIDCYSPIHQAHRKHLATIKPTVLSRQTVAGAIAVKNPSDGQKALKLINQSHGTSIAVSDGQILAAQQLLAREESIFIEPSSAATIAALQKLSRLGIFKTRDKIVCVLTGTGLKDTGVVKEKDNPSSPVSNLDQICARLTKNHWLK